MKRTTPAIAAVLAVVALWALLWRFRGALARVNWLLVVEAVKAVAWPVAALIALLVLKRPLVELVDQIAKRASKVSVFEVSVELAALPELRSTWSASGTDVRQLTPSLIFDSASASLFQELLSTSQGADYAIVDLGSGREWLTSRLFIFAAVLGEVRDLRAFVFLETAAGIRRRFVGVAAAAAVRRMLGRQYPWLDEALAHALATTYPAGVPVDTLGAATFSTEVSPLSPRSTTEHWRVTSFVQRFVERLQRLTDPPPHQLNSYLKFEDAPSLWERAAWLDGARLERDLSGALHAEWIVESPDTPRSQLSEGLTRRTAPFVALVDGELQFRGLVDRLALISQVAAVNATPR